MTQVKVNHTTRLLSLTASLIRILIPVVTTTIAVGLGALTNAKNPIPRLLVSNTMPPMVTITIDPTALRRIPIAITARMLILVRIMMPTLNPTRPSFGPGPIVQGDERN